MGAVPLSAAADTPAGAGGDRLVALTLDPPLRVPEGPVPAPDKAAIIELLGRQEEAVRRLDPSGYLATFHPAAAGRGSPLAPPALAASGRPWVRVLGDLFDAIPVGATVLHVDLTPRFFAPGPDDTADVLVSLVIAHQAPDRRLGLVELTVLQRLGSDESGRWWVFDWFQVPERQARLSWLVWLEGKVFLEPFDGRLQGEMTYHLYPGSPGAGQSLSLNLGESFTVTAVRGATGALAWERSGQTVKISLGGGHAGTSALQGDAQGPVVVTVVYEGYVTPEGGRRGNLEYLGGEGIHLRPATGWYPRLPGGGAVRGTLTVTVPGWWAAAAPGRLTGHYPASDVATFTWSLDPPAELYLAAGPYSVQTRETSRGVVVRTFFYPLKNEFAPGYLIEAEGILEFCSETFAPYPYPNLSLVEVPRFYYGGLSARSFVLLDKEWLFDPRVYAQARSLLAHEISHQWWGEMIPVWGDVEWFLWEGLATYSEALYAEARNGPEALTRAMRSNAVVYAEAVRGRSDLSITQANRRTEGWHDRLVYEKGAWVFHTLRFLMGDEVFFDLLRTYLDRFTGRPPDSAGLERLIALAAPEDLYLATYVERWVRETEKVDLTLTGVSARSTSGGGTSLTFTVADHGTGAFPRAEVAFFFRGGGSETVLAEAGTHTLEFARPLAGLAVDPNHWVLDLNRGNNSYRLLAGVAIADATIEAAFRSAPVVLIVLAILLAGRGLLRRKAAALRACPVDDEEFEC